MCPISCFGFVFSFFGACLTAAYRDTGCDRHRVPGMQRRDAAVCSDLRDFGLRFGLAFGVCDGRSPAAASAVVVVRGRLSLAVFAKLLHEPALLAQPLPDLAGDETACVQESRSMLECGCEALVFRCIADLLFKGEGLGVVKHGAVKQPGVNDLLSAKLDAALDDLSDEFPLPLVGGMEGAGARFVDFSEQPRFSL